MIVLSQLSSKNLIDFIGLHIFYVLNLSVVILILIFNSLLFSKFIGFLQVVHQFLLLHILGKLSQLDLLKLKDKNHQIRQSYPISIPLFSDSLCFQAQICYIIIFLDMMATSSWDIYPFQLSFRNSVKLHYRITQSFCSSVVGKRKSKKILKHKYPYPIKNAKVLNSNSCKYFHINRQKYDQQHEFVGIRRQVFPCLNKQGIQKMLIIQIVQKLNRKGKQLDIKRYSGICRTIPYLLEVIVVNMRRKKIYNIEAKVQNIYVLLRQLLIGNLSQFQQTGHQIQSLWIDQKKGEQFNKSQLNQNQICQNQVNLKLNLQQQVKVISILQTISHQLQQKQVNIEGKDCLIPRQKQAIQGKNEVMVSKEILKAILELLPQNISKNSKHKKFCGIDTACNPQSLVILWNIQEMPSNIINTQGQSRYIYLGERDTLYEMASQRLINFRTNEIQRVDDFCQLLDLEQKKKQNQNFIVFTQKNNITSVQINKTGLKTKFYIYDKENKQKVENYRVKYEKNQQLLMKKLKQHQLEKQLPNFLYAKPQEIEVTNRLVRVIHSMLNQQIDQLTRKKILQQFGQLLLQIAKKSMFYYIDQDSVKQIISKIYLKNQIIKCYTASTSAYKVLNNLLRSTRHPAEVYYVQPFFKGLYLQIKDILNEKITKQGKKNFYCHRGTWLTIDQIEKFKSSVGEVIFNLGFMSASKEKGEISVFGNCSLEIQVFQQDIDEKLCNGYADIEKYSDHPYEQEVLFNPLSNFLILETIQQEQTNRFKMKLCYGILQNLQKITNENIQNSLYFKKIQMKNIFTREFIIQKAKKLRQIAKSQRLEKQKIRCQGEILIQGQINLQGSKQYWQQYGKLVRQSLMKQFKAEEEKIEKKLLNNWQKWCHYDIQLLFNEQKFKQSSEKLFKKLQIEELTAYQNFCEEKEILRKNFPLKGPEVSPNIKRKIADQQLALGFDINFLQNFNDSVQALIALGNELRLQNNLEKAIKLYEKGKQILERKKYVTNHIYPQILVNLGNVYQEYGSHDLAIKNYQQATEIMENSFCKDNPDYIIVLICLGSSFQTKGDYLSAKDIYQKAKLKLQQIFGSQHPEYTRLLVNLGSLYLRNGDLNKAQQMYLRVKDIKIIKKETQNPQYAYVLVNLGNLYQSLGKNIEALNYFQQAISIIQAKLGKKHSDYAHVLVNLGNAYQKQQRLQESVVAYQKAIQIITQKVGTSNLQYAHILINLGNVYSAKKDYDSAIQIYERAKQLIKAKFGSEHDDFKAALLSLDSAYHSKEKKGQLISQQQNNSFNSTLMSLGRIYESKGKYHDAIRVYEEARIKILNKHGKQHQQYWKILNILGNALQTNGESQKAIQVYTQGRQIGQKIFGKDYSDNRNILLNLGNLFRIKGDLKNAEQAYERVKYIVEKKEGKEHINFAYILINLGNLYHENKQYEDSIGLYKESLVIIKQKFGQNHPEYAHILINLGNVYQSKGLLFEAFNLYGQSKKIAEKCLGADHYDYATALISQGNIFQIKGQHKNAIKIYCQAQRILQKQLGQSHLSYIHVLSNLGNLYTLTQEKEAALQYYEKAKQIAKIKSGLEEINLNQLLVYFGNSYQLNQEYQLQIQQYEKAIFFLNSHIKIDSHLDIQKFNLNQGKPPSSQIYFQNSFRNSLLLGESFYQNQQYDNAIKVFNDLKQKMRFKDRSYVDVLNKKANIFYSKGLYDDAIKLYQQSIEVQKLASTLQPHALLGLGNICYAKGQYQLAFQYYQKVFETVKNIYGIDNLKYAQALACLGKICLTKGNYSEAQEAYIRAKQIVEQRLGKDHLQTGYILIGLGYLYAIKGQHVSSFKLFNKAKDIIQLKLGIQHSQYGKVLINLGNLCDRQTQLDKAKSFYENAKQIIKKSLGEDHPQYAMVLANLGGLYHMKQKFQESLNLYEKSLKILEEKPKYYFLQYTQILYNYSLAHKKFDVNKYQNAQIQCRKNLLQLVFYQNVRIPRQQMLPYSSLRIAKSLLLKKDMRCFVYACTSLRENLETFGETHKNVLIVLSVLGRFCFQRSLYKLGNKIVQNIRRILRGQQSN